MIDMTPIIVTTINPLFGLLTLIVTGFMSYMAVKINKKADDAKIVTDATHTLVNSNMGIQLKIAANLAERIAGLTGKAQDIEDAEAAKKLYDDHMSKQAVVDQTKVI